MIELKSVTKSFGKNIVLRDISFRIDPEEFVCITGPSGVGKSTLLHLLTGAEVPTKGRVEVDGMDLRKIPPPILQLFRRRIGVVFQDYKLLPHRTVSENVAFPLEVCGLPQATIEKRVRDLQKQMGIEKLGGALPRELSGGEQARVAIARAIAAKPMILLADEPTGNIDPEQSNAVMKLFQGIHAEGTTVIIATHDSGLVDRVQTRVIRLEDGHIVRDSVGGYARARQKTHAEAHEGKHKIFVVRSGDS